MFFWHSEVRVSYGPRAKITVIWFLWKLKWNHCKKHTGVWLLLRDNCVFLLYCKNTESPKYRQPLNNFSLLCLSLHSLLPRLPPLWTSELWHKRMMERRSGAVTECSTVLHPGEEKKQDFISYASLSISALSPEEYAEEPSSVVFLMRCYSSFPLVHTSQEQLCLRRN